MDETLSARSRWRRPHGGQEKRGALRPDHRRPPGEVRAADLEAPLGRSEPTVSHHLSILADVGLLLRDPRGRKAWFRPVDARLAVLRAALGG